MSEQKQQPIISIDHVSMRFNLAKEKHESLKEYFVALLHGGVRFDEFFALSDVSFDIMPGDFYGLIGLNGSGKSTLLKALTGLLQPFSGQICIGSTDFTAATPQQRNEIMQHCGILYQSGALFSSMTLAENIALPLQRYTCLLYTSPSPRDA